ncbi:PREDICTED: trihelix transcription factor PTL [Theobroma cacao]|uniref:Trihelix transcription factor PTL n=2 Tax=Theobroma cacao TaxID=3641 RepID=A0AB32V3T0_THECC|nr:PREDICTED: trihelix transcription factor PTL [Theobroma cacao]EOY08130.1 Duplicated homeodomain-like superfamily protein, putative [Theobroma cacao]
MEMEDHHHHQYAMADLRQLMNGRPTHFQGIPQAPELFSSGHRNLPPPQPHHHQHHPHTFEMMQMVGRQVGHELMPRGLHHDFPADSTANNATPTAAAVAVTSASTPSASCGFDGEATAFGGDGGTGRWPRQETLTLLEIRSRLDPKFKEANQKGPLWDEVSRIMSEEHGYQRSGKKCREKFENLYKYYKKTKEGKAGRQDGKHYRFFRQLEALYGETSNSVSGPETQLIGNNFRFHGTPNSNTQANQDVYHSQKLCDSLSLSNSSDFDTSSSDDNDLSTAGPMENDSSEKRKKKRGSRSWKAKIKEFIDSQMRKLMERQEAWLEKLTKTLEQKEQERVLREEEWRKEEAARIDREHKFWAKERAWIEARDAALMEALQNLTGKQLKVTSPEELMATEMQNHSENQNENGSETINNTVKADGWQESEISRLIQLRTSMESRFHQGACSEEILWEEIAAKMACLGFDRSALMCKEKWNSISAYLMKTKESNKKRKENSRGCGYYQNNEALYSQGRAYCEINEQGSETVRLQANDGSSPSNSNVGNAVNDSCFRFLMADGENLWENYGLKLSKGENQ